MFKDALRRARDVLNIKTHFGTDTSTQPKASLDPWAHSAYTTTAGGEVYSVSGNNSGLPKQEEQRLSDSVDSPATDEVFLANENQTALSKLEKPMRSNEADVPEYSSTKRDNMEPPMKGVKETRQAPVARRNANESNEQTISPSPTIAPAPNTVSFATNSPEQDRKLSSPVDPSEYMTTVSDQLEPPKKKKRSLFRGSMASIDRRASLPGAHQERCTDVFCCLLFFIFISGLVAVSVYVFIQGDPIVLTHPADSNGKLCGLGEHLKKKYLFIFDLLECAKYGPAVFYYGCPSPEVCVEKCPDVHYVFIEDVKSQDKSRLICKDGVNVTEKTVEKLVLDNECAAYYLKSIPISERCVPLSALLDHNETITNLMTSHKNAIDKSLLKHAISVYEFFLKTREYKVQIVKDLDNSKYRIVMFLLLAMVIMFIWIILMRCLAYVMVWLMISLFVLIWPLLSLLCWKKYQELKGTKETAHLPWINGSLEVSKHHAYFAGGVIFAAIFGITIILLLLFVQSIRLALSLISTGSRAVSAMWSSLLWSGIPGLLQLGVVLYIGLTLLYLAAVERVKSLDGNSTNKNENVENLKNDFLNMIQINDCTNSTDSGLCLFEYQKQYYLLVVFVYVTFMFFWLVNFVSALNQLTLAGAFASYYWAMDKSNLPHLSALSAFVTSCRYHIGSMALGSFLIAFVQFLSTLIDLISHRLVKSKNKVAQFILKCLKCCLVCQEKMLQYISKYAYIMIAIEGNNFCKSAKKSVRLLAKNLVRSFILLKITEMLFVMNKILITIAVVYLTFLFGLDVVGVKFNFIPLIAVAVGTYVIADIFLSTYQMAVETLFLCYLDDLDAHVEYTDVPLPELMGRASFYVTLLGDHRKSDPDLPQKHGPKRFD